MFTAATPTFPARNVKDIPGTISLQLSVEQTDYQSAIELSITCVSVDNEGHEEHLGYISGYIIKREDMDFEQMDELCADAEDLLATLYDEGGSLKAASKHDTGLFGAELEQGDILLIERTEVLDEYKRHGVGKEMVEQMLKIAKKSYGVAWAFAWATQTGLEPEEKEPNSDRYQGGWYRTRSEDFFRSTGFRKVGRTHWLCYAMDQRHPSRSYDAKRDSFDDFYQALKGR